VDLGVSIGVPARIQAGLACLLVVVGCNKQVPDPEPAPPPPPPPVEEPATTPLPSGRSAVDVDREVAEREAAIERLRAELAESRGENARLVRELAELGEAHATLELELGSAVEELLRSHANLRNVQSRAFAVSRIAEVRVGLDGYRGRKDAAFTSRVERADEFLARADGALADRNVGGAAYLAERAGELLRQVRTVAELKKKESRELIPIVPERWFEVRSRANLRKGAGTDHTVVRTVDAGTKVMGMARQGDWYQVQTEDGATVWIHRHLVSEK
jgi:hypothetical protein